MATAGGGTILSRGTETYTFSSKPRSTAPPTQDVANKRNATMSQPIVSNTTAATAGGRYGNIMYDRRVIRGNTYALHTLPASAIATQTDPLELQKREEARKKFLAQRRIMEQNRIISPEPEAGRKHMDMQTEMYLEELTDRIEEADNYTQTDAFLDRPPTPLFIPAKTGRDVSTQIEDDDLFDFNLESKPIVEILVGKSIEQALLEVMEEEELCALRAQQRRFEQKRHAELVETQRVEGQERRRTEEKNRRMDQQRAALALQKETSRKIAARAFAKSYLSDLVPSVFDTLTAHGFFHDPVEREIEQDFMPWLLNEVQTDLNATVLSRRLLDNIIMNALGLSDTTATTTTTANNNNNNNNNNKTSQSDDTHDTT